LGRAIDFYRFIFNILARCDTLALRAIHILGGYGMGRINEEWHKEHKMPPKPTEDQRIVWHLEHVKNCSCMPIPKGVIEIMNKRGIPLAE
jgi:hypothetical protein